MSTVFIALQCFQCSTMQETLSLSLHLFISIYTYTEVVMILIYDCVAQVKQQKKSSNQWTCVVCNEKQSVRKVFARGFMARDVRKFVQTFNMSRQFAKQQQQQCSNETLDPVLEQADNQPHSNHRKRSDWSEFIDPKDDHDSHEEDEKEDSFGPRIVTKFPPKALYKKPKLDTESSGFGTQDGEKDFRPIFAKRNSNKGKEPRKFDPTSNWASKRFDFTSQAEEGISAVEGPQWSLAKGDSSRRTYAKQQVEDSFAESRACLPTTAKVSLTKWGPGDYIIQDNNEDSEDKGPPKCQLGTMKRASKWEHYITEDDDDRELCLGIGREFADHKGKWDDCIFDSTLYDQSVEEDIHPDFL